MHERLLTCRRKRKKRKKKGRKIRAPSATHFLPRISLDFLIKRPSLNALHERYLSDHSARGTFTNSRRSMKVNKIIETNVRSANITTYANKSK